MVDDERRWARCRCASWWRPASRSRTCSASDRCVTSAVWPSSSSRTSPFSSLKMITSLLLLLLLVRHLRIFFGFQNPIDALYAFHYAVYLSLEVVCLREAQAFRAIVVFLPDNELISFMLTMFCRDQLHTGNRQIKRERARLLAFGAAAAITALNSQTAINDFYAEEHAALAADYHSEG